jgi:hypothetical protein
VQASVRNGKGSATIPYEQRIIYGLSSAAPGSSYVAGMMIPKLTEYLIQADNNQAIAKGFTTDRLPLGTAMLLETLKFGDTRFMRLGIRERYDKQAEWTTAPMIAEVFSLNPEVVFVNDCWKKLPAYDLDPAGSSASGEGLPHATLRLSGGRRNGSMAR